MEILQCKMLNAKAYTGNAFVLYKITKEGMIVLC